MKKLLKNKLYMTLFASDLLSNFGDVMYYLALMSYVLQLPNAKLAIAIVSVSETLPILTSFVMGYFADRQKDKVTTIVQTLIFRVVLYVIVGVVMGFQAGLGVVIVASLINFLSDLAGRYENGLYTPLSLRIIADDEREISYSFHQAVSSVFYIGFQSAGAVLVSLMSYQALAFVNAGTFAICALMMLACKPALNKLLIERPLQVEEKRDESLLKDMWQSLKMAIKESMVIPEMRASLVVVPILNGLLSVLSVIIAVLISQDANFVIINSVTTLAAVTFFTIIGGILGSILAMTVLKDLRLVSGLRLVTLPVPILFFSLYMHNIYGVFASMLLTTVIAACLNPKFGAMMMNSLPEEKLGIISGGISTYFQLGTIVLRLLVSGLILVMPIDWLSLFFLFMGLGLIAYAYLGVTTEKKLS